MRIDARAADANDWPNPEAKNANPVPFQVFSRPHGWASTDTSCAPTMASWLRFHRRKAAISPFHGQVLFENHGPKVRVAALLDVAEGRTRPRPEQTKEKSMHYNIFKLKDFILMDKTRWSEVGCQPVRRPLFSGTIVKKLVVNLIFSVFGQTQSKIIAKNKHRLYNRPAFLYGDTQPLKKHPTLPMNHIGGLATGGLKDPCFSAARPHRLSKRARARPVNVKSTRKGSMGFKTSVIEGHVWIIMNQE